MIFGLSSLFFPYMLIGHLLSSNCELKTVNCDSELWTANCKLWTVNCEMQTTTLKLNCNLDWTADYKLELLSASGKHEVA